VLVLGIETATARGSVAIVGPDGTVGVRAAHVPGGHLEWLLPAIDDLLTASNLARNAVEGLAVSVGPGGFTGLRIGLMTATAWADGLGRAVAGVSTLEAIAAGAEHPGQVLAALDARRGQVTAALFHVEAGRAQRLTPDLLAHPADLRALLPPADGLVLLAGDALEHHAEALLAGFAPHAAAAAFERWWPRADVVAALGRARLVAGEADDPLRLAPRYARAPVAK
jgi:tRNA threonylcarbamoyladenosine biosynthesis protein TsaB